MNLDMTAMRPETEVTVLRIFLGARVLRVLVAVSFFVIAFGLFDTHSTLVTIALAVALIPLSWGCGIASYWISVLVIAGVASYKLCDKWGKRTGEIQKHSGKRAFGKLDIWIQRYKIRHVWLSTVGIACIDHLATGSASFPFMVALIGIIAELYQTIRLVTVKRN